MNRNRSSRLLSASRLYRGAAIVLPALLGQGLIYLCIMGRIDMLTALAAIFVIGATALAAASLSRSESHQRLVRRNAPPPMHRLRTTATH